MGPDSRRQVSNSWREPIAGAAELAIRSPGTRLIVSSETRKLTASLDGSIAAILPRVPSFSSTYSDSS